MQKYLSFESDKIELQKILDENSNETELKKMAELELNDLKLNNEKTKKIEIISSPKDEADKNAIIEIKLEQEV